MAYTQSLSGGLLIAAASFACSAGDPSATGGPKSAGGSAGTLQASGGSAGLGTGGRFIPGLPAGGSAGSGGGECGGYSLTTAIVEEVSPANLLVIMDRSQSLGAEWLSASDAFIGAIAPIADALTVGAIFFPSGPGGFDFCASPVDDITAPSQIDFRAGPAFIDAWAQSWTNAGLYLGTPTDPAAQKADLALERLSTMNTNPTTVLVMTDGAPTCRPQDPLLWMDAFAASWLAERNIKTYVLGIVGGGVGFFPLPPNAPELSAVAVAGGTGAFISPGDNALLAQELQGIVSKIVVRTLAECDIRLDPPPPNLDDVHLVATDSESGQKYEIPIGPEGWILSGDGSLATLDGLFCEDAKSGAFTSIEFTFGCVDVPVLIR
jgi:hypothetical protein